MLRLFFNKRAVGRRVLSPPIPRSHRHLASVSPVVNESSRNSVPLEVRQVREGDLEGFLCCAMLQKEARASAFAVRALNLELASVRAAARGNANAGRVRIAFWRELLDAAFARAAELAPRTVDVSGSGSGPSGLPWRQAVSSHPLFAPLSSAIAAHGHTRRWLERMIDARDAGLDAPPPATLSQAERYAEDTAGSMLLLALEACGVRSSGSGRRSAEEDAAAAAAETAAAHAGRAIGLISLLRALPVAARVGERLLPDEIMTKVSSRITVAGANCCNVWMLRV